MIRNMQEPNLWISWELNPKFKRLTRRIYGTVLSWCPHTLEGYIQILINSPKTRSLKFTLEDLSPVQDLQEVLEREIVVFTLLKEKRTNLLQATGIIAAQLIPTEIQHLLSRRDWEQFREVMQGEDMPTIRPAKILLVPEEEGPNE